MYEAIIGRINLKQHPNADKLLIGNVLNYQIVVGKDSYKDGDLVIVFPEGGCLSHEYCYENSEYRENKGANKDSSKSGYFESNRRIKMIKLRGEISEAYCAPISSLSYAGDYTKLKEGDELSSFNGHELCAKYYNPATLAAIQKAKKSGRKYFELDIFKKHYDTGHFKKNIKRIPEDVLLWITSKLHGTSGRTGKFVLPKQINSGWKGIWNSFSWLNQLHTFTENVETLVTGSRNVTYDPFDEKSLYVTKEKYRKEAEKLFSNIPLNSIFYYEIVGYDDVGKPLFEHNIPNNDEFGKELRKKYGPKVEYSYGLPQAPNSFGVYVYRVVTNVGTKHEIELSWNQIYGLCLTLGLKTVPELDVLTEDDFDSLEDLYKKIYKHTKENDEFVKNKHPREGICVRIEHPNIKPSEQILKLKGDEFCYLEGIAKSSDDYIDSEEIS